METFGIKTQVHFGEGSLKRLADMPYKRVLVITDPFVVESGMIDLITGPLEKGEAQYEIYSNVVPDAPVDKIADGVKKFLQYRPDALVAVGGGSAIDSSKAIREFASRMGADTHIPLIAIPTTSGTGSEVTQFAVVTDSKTGVKIPLIDESLMPDIAILDPELVKSAPPFITADTGMDVITHAIEAYVSETASDCSDCLAEKAMELAFEYLPKAYRNGYDIKARDKMHRASCLAGMAFSLVNLGLNHGIAHALGAIFHIPHGRANALVLPHVIYFNADMDREAAKHSNDSAKKYQKLARIVGLPAPTVKVGVSNLISEINRLLKYMDRPMCITECGVTLEEFEANRDEIVRRALADACTQANPRKVTADDVNKILDHIAK